MNATISGCSAHQSAERSRPLARAPHLVHLLAGEDDAAVDDPGDDRRELLGGDRDHGLVEQGETFAHPSVLDQHVALAVDREREEVAVAEALADANGLLCGRGCRGEVSGGLVLEHRRQEQVAALGALALVLEEPLCAAEPARRRADLAAGGEVQADPHRAADRAKRLPVLEIPLMRALEPRDRLVVAAEHEGAVARSSRSGASSGACSCARTRTRTPRATPASRRPHGLARARRPDPARGGSLRAEH